MSRGGWLEVSGKNRFTRWWKLLSSVFDLPRDGYYSLGSSNVSGVVVWNPQLSGRKYYFFWKSSSRRYSYRVLYLRCLRMKASAASCTSSIVLYFLCMEYIITIANFIYLPLFTIIGHPLPKHQATPGRPRSLQ